MFELRNWVTLSKTSENKFPGHKITMINGAVYNHIKYEDGHRITTSIVTDIDTEKRIITTYSGGKYLLAASGEDLSCINVLQQDRE